MPVAVGIMADSYKAPAGGGATPPVTGYVAWFDASDAASITSSAGAVSQWSDKSPSGFHMLQATGTKQPVTGTQTINGRNVIRFDGTDDWMTAGVQQVVNATTGEWSAFAVVRPTLLAAARHAVDQDSGSGATKVAAFIRTNVAAFAPSTYTTAGIANIESTGTTLTVNVAARVSAIATATTFEAWHDGVSNGSIARTSPPNTGTFGFGLGSARTTSTAAFFWSGDIAEAIVYNRAVTEPERIQIESYLTAKWGTP